MLLLSPQAPPGSRLGGRLEPAPPIGLCRLLAASNVPILPLTLSPSLYRSTPRPERNGAWRCLADHRLGFEPGSARRRTAANVTALESTATIWQTAQVPPPFFPPAMLHPDDSRDGACTNVSDELRQYS